MSCLTAVLDNDMLANKLSTKRALEKAQMANTTVQSTIESPVSYPQWATTEGTKCLGRRAMGSVAILYKHPSATVKGT